MKLLNLYLEEVKNLLPRKNREDILQEIQSSIMDTIEDRNPYPGEKPDEEIVREVLMEFGAPKEVAKQYAGKNFLIGPRMFPIYLTVLKIVLIVVAGLNILGVIVLLVNHAGLESSVFSALLEAFGGLFSSLFTAFGVVTLSFAGIERTAPEEWSNAIKEWTPDSLLKRQDKERIKVSGLAIEITLSLIYIAFLYFFLDRFAIYYVSSSGWVSVPILNENFLRYIPWITAYTVLDIGVKLYLIRKGYWDSIASIAKVLVNVFNIAVTYAIIKGPDIITIDPTAWQKINLGLSATAEGVSQTLNTIVTVLLWLSILGMVVESFKRIYDSFIKGSHVDIELDPEELDR